jgi:hypothetical protein
MQIIVTGEAIIGLLAGSVFVFCVGTLGNECRALRARLDDYRISLAKLENRLDAISEQASTKHQSRREP